MNTKLENFLGDIQDFIEFKRENGEAFGMFCRKDISSIDGAVCTLYVQKKHHSRNDIKRAKQKAKSMWDIVRFEKVILED